MQNIVKLFAAGGGVVEPGTDRQTTGIDTSHLGEDTLMSNITNIINGIIAVLGIVCVVVMIIGGINYMTSSGESAKVKKAKDTILYGLIGLVVCVLAFAIVNFVINNIIGN